MTIGTVCVARCRTPLPLPEAITGAHLAPVGTEADWATVAGRVSVSSRLTSSANHLIGLEEERRGNGQAEHLGRLEVDDQLELHRLLHG